MPACGGASFSFTNRSANFEEAWAPTWASRKAVGERPGGREHDSSSVRDFFINLNIAFYNHSVQE